MQQYKPPKTLKYASYISINNKEDLRSSNLKGRCIEETVDVLDYDRHKIN